MTPRSWQWSRNVRNRLPMDAASHLRRKESSGGSLLKH